MLHRLLITLVWVVVVTLGYVSYVFYTSTRQDQTPIFARVEQYQDDWHKALNNVKTTPPPSLEEFVRKAPVWQRPKLRKQVGPLDEQHQTEYRKQADQPRTMAAIPRLILVISFLGMASLLVTQWRQFPGEVEWLPR